MTGSITAKGAAIGLVSALCFALTAAAYADSSNRVKFVKRASLEVGQAMVFHGLRGECGKLPDKAQLKNHSTFKMPSTKPGVSNMANRASTAAGSAMGIRR
ncbi:MAG: hypothetical protein AB8B47_05125 [Roseobacter sp.]